VSLRQNGVGASFVRADAIPPKGHSSAVRGTITTSRCRLSGTTWPGIKSELFRLAYAQFRLCSVQPFRNRQACQQTTL